MAILEKYAVAEHAVNPGHAIDWINSNKGCHASISAEMHPGDMVRGVSPTHQLRKGILPHVYNILIIDKPDMRHIVRSGLCETILSWVQELGRADHDGQVACATILYHKSVWKDC